MKDYEYQLGNLHIKYFIRILIRYLHINCGLRGCHWFTSGSVKQLAVLSSGKSPCFLLGEGDTSLYMFIGQ